MDTTSDLSSRRGPSEAVVVSCAVEAATDRVWQALVEPDVVGKWFGDLDVRLSEGACARLSFGDGDYFEIFEVRAEAPSKLEYGWRFLGTSPVDRISWELCEREEGCTSVTVRDFQPDRTAAQREEMLLGWSDFLERLRVHVATGADTRYDWRRDFEGATELGVPLEQASRLLEGGRLGTWSPVVPRERDGTLHVEIIEAEDLHVALRVREAGWSEATECRIAVVPSRHGSSLRIVHSGWDGISRFPDECKQARHRWARAWIRALRSASGVAMDGRIP